MKYIFGPVPSRRLGVSLGVDVVPLKTCTFDCVYCQLGVTKNKTIDRQAFVSKASVLNELKEVLDKEANRIDFVTFSGSGEPTLNSEIGEMIEQIKTFTNVPIAVLTNGSLLYRDDVRKDLCKADLVVPSLDAITEDTFLGVNRPHKSLKLEMIVEGLKTFSQEFQGKIWLEIMLVKNINDDINELKYLADLVRGIKLSKIHLNTVVRPPAEEFAFSITREEMANIANLFDERVEIIADFDKIVEHKIHANNEFIKDQIMSLLKRRPCTVDDIATSLGIHINEAIKYVNHLIENGLIRQLRSNNNWYYEISKQKEDI
ncbi:MAG: Radical protein [Candidatus Poribacteria bacterium]|nr:Radical protein [Candidatus Poribacteria bacterium]